MYGRGATEMSSACLKKYAMGSSWNLNYSVIQRVKYDLVLLFNARGTLGHPIASTTK